MDKIEKLAKKHTGLFALGSTLICFLLIHTILPLFFQEDDLFISTAISGDYNGSPVAVFPFVSSTLCQVLAVFYQLIPSFGWYQFLMEALLVSSCAAVNYCLLKCANRRGLPAWLPISIFCFVFFGVLVPMCMPISFTMVAGICGIGAIALLLSTTGSEKLSADEIFVICMSVVLIVFSAMIRKNSCMVSLCFYALAVLYLLCRHFSIGQEIRKQRKLLPLFLAFCVVASGVSYIAMDHATIANTDSNNSRWNNYRSAFLDYSKLSYEEAPEIYENVGWNEEYYELVAAWYLADDGFNTDALAEIRSQQLERLPNATLLGSIKTTFSVLISYLTDYLNITFLVVLLLLIVSAVVYTRKQNNQLVDSLFILCALSGLLLMWLYLSYIGRFRFHVFRLTTVQAIVILATVVVLNIPADSLFARIPAKTAWRLILFIFFALLSITAAGFFVDNRLLRLGCFGAMVALPTLAILWCAWKNRSKVHFLPIMAAMCLFTVWYLPTAFLQYTSSTDFADLSGYSLSSEVIKQYAKENPSSVYVRPPFFYHQQCSIFDRGETSDNLFCAVDFLKYTDPYYEKLAKNGLDDITIDSYFEENVYYLGYTEDDEMLPLLLAYMKTEYGETVAVQVREELDHGVSVYQFIK